jgi:hypothetical protein
MRKKQAVCLFTITILSIWFMASAAEVSGWSNGGYSADPNNPDYGTHDWIAEHALDWLPQQEKQFLLDNKTSYLYGTELPDNSQAPDGIGDTTKHHVYYSATGTVQDDAAAVRAQEEYVNVVNFYDSGNFGEAAKHLGMVTHYIADMAVFGHVMGASTAWGAETHHSDYEDYVETRTNSYQDDFNGFLVFDGNLDTLSAYDAALTLSNDTTFDANGQYTCVWMDQNYNWNDATFKNRCGESLNLAVNLVADVLHTFCSEAVIPEFPSGGILPLFMIATLLLGSIYRIKRKQLRRKCLFISVF